MYKENGMEKPADNKEKAASTTKEVKCPRCNNGFDVGTSTVFGEKLTCTSCGFAFIN